MLFDDNAALRCIDLDKATARQQFAADSAVLGIATPRQERAHQQRQQGGSGSQKGKRQRSYQDDVAQPFSLLGSCGNVFKPNWNKLL